MSDGGGPKVCAELPEPVCELLLCQLLRSRSRGSVSSSSRSGRSVGHVGVHPRAALGSGVQGFAQVESCFLYTRRSLDAHWACKWSANRNRQVERRLPRRRVVEPFRGEPVLGCGYCRQASRHSSSLSDSSEATSARWERGHGRVEWAVRNNNLGGSGTGSSLSHADSLGLHGRLRALTR